MTGLRVVVSRRPDGLVPMLVGIVIEYHEDLNVVVATDIREAINK
jgi:hypothetical protein